MNSSTTLDQLTYIRKMSVLREMFDEKLRNLVRTKDEEEVFVANETVTNLEKAVEDYRGKIRDSIKKYTESHFYLERENNLLNVLREAMDKMTNSMDSYHYTDESKPMLDSIEKFMDSLMTQDDIQTHKTNIDQAVAELKRLTASSKYLQGLFEFPLCPICLEQKCEVFMPCGHMYCKCCIRLLRSQSGSSRSPFPTVVCALCRDTSSYDRVSPLHYP